MKTEKLLWLRRSAAVGSLMGVLFTGIAAVGQGQQSGSRGGYGTQQPGTPPSQRSGPGASGSVDLGRIPDSDGMVEKIESQQAKTRNSERQRRLQADTEKLLSLATDLKAQVDKTDKNILSIDVIKRADEIEKLAKSVKERMKG